MIIDDTTIKAIQADMRLFDGLYDERDTAKCIRRREGKRKANKAYYAANKDRLKKLAHAKHKATYSPVVQSA